MIADQSLSVKIRDEMLNNDPADEENANTSKSRKLLRPLESRMSGPHNHDRVTKSNDETPRDPMTGEIFRTFMFENKLITQVPIGYTRSTSRPRTCFTPHTSEMLRPENTPTPGYYKLRHG